MLDFVSSNNLQQRTFCVQHLYGIFKAAAPSAIDLVPGVKAGPAQVRVCFKERFKPAPLALFGAVKGLFESTELTWSMVSTVSSNEPISMLYVPSANGIHHVLTRT